MENLMTHFYELFTVAWLLALVNIIIIDIVMSWDNAIIIWMATRNLPVKLRKKAITIWIVLATIMRIWFAFFATFLLWVVWIRLAWWLLLLYVVWKFYKELRLWWNHHEEWLSSKAKEVWFLTAIYTIVIADVSMSLDNVLAVAWAANENIVALWVWLIFSILLMAFASNFIAKNLNRFPIIQWVWLLVILFVAVEMILKWAFDIENTLHFSNLMPILTVLISIVFIYLHQTYILGTTEEKIKNYLQKNYLGVIWSFTALLIIFVNLWDKIANFIQSHDAYLYSINFILLLVLLEIVTLFKNKRKS